MTLAARSRSTTFTAPGERPDVEVASRRRVVDGELRMWSQRDDGSWWADVQWRPSGEPTRRLDTFAADLIRPAEEPPASIRDRPRVPTSLRWEGAAGTLRAGRLPGPAQPPRHSSQLVSKRP